MNSILTQAREELGLLPMAAACGVTYQAVRKWERFGFPRTEWTGETEYALRISELAMEKAEDPSKYSPDKLLKHGKEEAA